jgi:hypothetical protein
MNHSDLYGASHIAANYCGYRKVPFFSGEIWQHGWVSDGLSIPEQVFGGGIQSKDTALLVATQAQESFLKEHGYANTHATGLPSVYLPSLDQPREENTLLVMPGHTVPGMGNDSNQSVNYMNHIRKHASSFEKTTVCVFGTDYDQKGVWRTAFEDAGFEVIRGVDHKYYALELQKRRFMKYSHMTTNVFGSHIIYACAYGAKVSISGNYEAPKEENYKNIPFYKDYPNALTSAVNLFSEETMRTKHPWLFCNPDGARSNIPWGESQIGMQCKKTPKHLKNIMGWSPNSILHSRKSLELKVRRLVSLALSKV